MTSYQKTKLFAFTIVAVLITSIAGHAVSGAGMVIGDNTTVRSEGSLNGSVVQTLPIGARVIINDLINDFYQVDLKSNDLNGWIHKDLILPDKNTLKEKVQKGMVTATTLNIRSGPSTETGLQGQLKQGQQIQIIGEKEIWFQINDERGIKGWVHSDYIEMIPNLPMAYVVSSKANVYTHKDKNGGLIEVLEQNETFFIKNYQNGWYLVKTDSGIEGWVTREEVKLIVNGNGPVSRGASRGALGDIVGITEKYLGSPYRYAASGPNQFDCSGFVFFVFHEYYGDQLRQHGINFPRTSRDQAKIGTTISRDQLQVGDLVFFNNGSTSRINHVGIYIGGNDFIHASSGSNMSVIVSSLNSNNYNRRYLTAKRPF